MPSVGRLRFLEALPAPETKHRKRGALVLLHAFPLSGRMWEAQLALAAHGWHVIAPNVRGVDGQDGDPPANTIDDYAADIIDLLDGLHVEEAVVGGLSMGGYIVFALLRHAPSYVRALILADTRSQADTPEGLEGRKKLLAVVNSQGADAVADQMIPKLLGETTRATKPEIAEHVRGLIRSNSSEAIAGGIRALMSRPDSTPQLAAIHVPTLVVVGEEDVITPQSAAEELHSRIAGSELVCIPAAGHLSNLEQPAAFNSALARFLEHRV
ncbi:MAG TPA: alpha/beta fold hydrolase [Vicinamibacterales bacterium]